MGWSWSLWICQSMVCQIGYVRGDAQDGVIADKQVTAPLESKTVANAKYVDNYVYISHDPEAADAECNSLAYSLTDKGLVVHECFTAAPPCTFAGIDFDGAHCQSFSQKRMETCPCYQISLDSR